ncbi:hypothetical protein Tco_0983272, partial [Tanacetum coccineum]
MKRAHSCFSDLGTERFFRTGEVGRRERNWFALNLCNIGLKSGQEKNYRLCGELFRICAEYYAGEKLSMNPLMDNEVKEANELLERAEK